MNKDQMIACVDDAVKAHVEHLFDVFRLSILGSPDPTVEQVNHAREAFSQGLFDILIARDLGVSVIKGMPDK